MGRRFVDMRTIHQRMHAKDARIAREMKARWQQLQDAKYCPKCGSYAWRYDGDRQVCADCGAE